MNIELKCCKIVYIRKYKQYLHCNRMAKYYNEGTKEAICKIHYNQRVLANESKGFKKL